MAVAVALLANVFVEAIAIALFAQWVARTANCLAGQSFQFSLAFRSNVLVEVSLRTGLRLVQALNNLKLHVDDCFVATQAAIGSNVVGRAVAAPVAVPVTVLAFAIGVVILCVWTFLHAEWPVLDMLALVALPRTLSRAGEVTLLVALHALPVARTLEKSLFWEA